MFRAFKKWDIGDLFQVTGFVFKTRTGEISVHAKELKLLTKSLLPLPEKFHGLQDTDTRYRKRYLDLIMNRMYATPLRSALPLSVKFASFWTARALWR